MSLFNFTPLKEMDMAKGSKEQAADSSDDGFTRRELLQQARRRGISVPRGVSDKEIDRLISDRFRADHDAIRDAL